MPARSTATASHLHSNRLREVGAATLLAELQAAHGRIEVAMVEMEAVAASGAPDEIQFSTARMRIGAANLERSKVSRKVAGHLMAMTTIEDTSAVRRLSSMDAEQYQLTSELIRFWTPAAVRKDWDGYCAASLKVRDRIREIIKSEKALLYPLLKKATQFHTRDRVPGPIGK